MSGIEGEHLLLCDNLKGQDIRPLAGPVGAQTRALAAKHNIRIWNYLAGCTDELQVSYRCVAVSDL